MFMVRVRPLPIWPSRTVMTVVHFGFYKSVTFSTGNVAWTHRGWRVTGFDILRQEGGGVVGSYTSVQQMN